MENFHAEERLLWHESPSNVLPTNGKSDLLPQLRWLSWLDIPPTFNITYFSMEDVVILDLSRSKIMHDWEGWSHVNVMKNLKVMNVQLANLQRLPDELGRELASLEYLSLEDCRSLERLPDSIGNLESLIELDISGTRIKELPNSIGKLENLKNLKMQRSDISKIPDALWTIEKLEEIEASKKNSSKHFHVNVGNCIYKNQSLRILRLDGADIRPLPRLPESIIKLKLSRFCMDTFPKLSNITDLKELYLQFGSRDSDGKSYGPVEDSIPQWIGNLTKLESLTLGSCYVTTSPTDLSLPPRLKSLYLGCPNLCHLLRLPLSLSSLNLYECHSLCSMEDLSNLKKLSSLLIWRSTFAEIEGLGRLENLRVLMLWSLIKVEKLPDLSNLNKLRRLIVGFCFNLVEIQGELPKSLEGLEISSYMNIQKLPDLSTLNRLQKVIIKCCMKFECGGNFFALLGEVSHICGRRRMSGTEKMLNLNLNMMEEKRHKCTSLLKAS